MANSRNVSLSLEDAAVWKQPAVRKPLSSEGCLFAEKLVQHSLEQCVTADASRDSVYFEDVKPCPLYFPSKCFMAQDTGLGSLLTRTQSRFFSHTIDHPVPITTYFPDCECDLTLEPCLQRPSICAKKYKRTLMDVDQQEPRIELEKILARWNLSEDWKYSISFHSCDISNDSHFFKYILTFSKPTIQRPVPIIANVLFVVTLPFDGLPFVWYELEGSGLKRWDPLTPTMLEELVRFKEQLLQDGDLVKPTESSSIVNKVDME